MRPAIGAFFPIIIYIQYVQYIDMVVRGGYARILFAKLFTLHVRRGERKLQSTLVGRTQPPENLSRASAVAFVQSKKEKVPPAVVVPDRRQGFLGGDQKKRESIPSRPAFSSSPLSRPLTDPVSYPRDQVVQRERQSRSASQVSHLYGPARRFVGGRGVPRVLGTP